MAKFIDKGLGTKDDPVYDPGWIVGPVTVSKPSEKDGDKEEDERKERR